MFIPLNRLLREYIVIQVIRKTFFIFNISQLVSSGVHGNTGSQGKLGFYRITLVPSDFLKALAAIRFILKLLSLFLDFTNLGSAKIL